MPWTDTAEGEGYAGQAPQTWPRGSSVEPYSRTCPNWFARSPFVQSIMAQLDDYRENRLGPVQLLPWPLLCYLRVANAAAKAVKSYWDEELIGGE